MSEREDTQKWLENLKQINAPLKRAIAAYHDSQNNENASKVLSSLLHAHLLVPVIFVQSIPAKTQQVSFYVIRNEEGKAFFQAFTDVEEVSAWSKECAEKEQYMTFDFHYLVDVLRKNPEVGGYVINSNDVPFLINRSMLLQLGEHIKEQIQNTAL